MTLDDTLNPLWREIEQANNGEKYLGIVIYPPTIDWNTLRQRPQQIMMEFARKGYLAIYCTTNGGSKTEVDGARELEHGLFLTNHFQDLFDVPHPIILITYPFHYDLLFNFTGEPTVVYEIIDEIEIFGSDIVLLKNLDDRLTKIADVITATATSLWKRKQSERPDIALVENGADISHFMRSVDNSEIPEDISTIKKEGKPIIGYYGALAQWFDYNLILQAAAKRPDLNFVLIGRDYDGTIHPFLSTATPNIRYIGGENNQGVPYETLHGYLAAFDVATIPFRADLEIIKSTNPVKMFEYMAGGKPIVATNMLEARKYDVVFIADNGVDTFLSKIDEALSAGKDPNYVDRLKTTAKENSWSKRVDAIIGAINISKKRNPRRFTIAKAEKRTIDELKGCGRKLVQSNNYTGALTLLERVCELDPLDIMINFKIGQLHLLHLKDYQRAARALERAVETLPRSAWAHLYLGEAYLHIGHYNEGERVLNKVLTLPDYYNSRKRAQTLLANHQSRLELHKRAKKQRETGSFKNAEDIYHEILQLDKNDRLADFGIGKIYLVQERYEAALEHFRRTVQLIPKSPYSYLYLGIAQFKLGKQDDAKATLEEGLKYAGENASARSDLERWLVKLHNVITKK